MQRQSWPRISPDQGDWTNIWDMFLSQKLTELTERYHFRPSLRPDSLAASLSNFLEYDSWMQLLPVDWDDWAEHIDHVMVRVFRRSSMAARVLSSPVSLVVFLPIIYGEIHLTAIKFNFASNAERLLWLIASIDTMPTSWGLLFLFVVLKRLVELSCYPRMEPSAKLVARICFYPTYLFLMVYTLSRVYLVVEPFISLQHVPIGVYATIPWIQNIPRIVSQRTNRRE